MSQFGFGRRTCQGVDIVEQELFLVMGGLAWGFEFEMRSVKEGRQQEIEALWRTVNGGQVEDLVDDLSVDGISYQPRTKRLKVMS